MIFRSANLPRLLRSSAPLSSKQPSTYYIVDLGRQGSSLPRVFYLNCALIMAASTPDGAQKVPLYSLNGKDLSTSSKALRLTCSLDLKNTTDDALAPYLTKLPKPYTLKQSHYYTDIRLALGYAAVLIGGVTFLADYKLGWERTKDATAVACVVYFILNGCLTYWIWMIEAGKVFVGHRQGGQKVQL